MAEPIFIDAGGVARLLGLPDAEAFLRRRRALEERCDFPLPLPWWKRPVKYRRDMVLAWINLQGRPGSDEDARAAAVAAGLATGKVALLEKARQA